MGPHTVKSSEGMSEMTCRRAFVVFFLLLNKIEWILMSPPGRSALPLPLGGRWKPYFTPRWDEDLQQFLIIHKPNCFANFFTMYSTVRKKKKMVLLVSYFFSSLQQRQVQKLQESVEANINWSWIIDATVTNIALMATVKTGHST